MLNNFRVASRTADERKEILDVMNTELHTILAKDGIGGLQARPDYQVKLARLFREMVMDEFSMTDPTPLFTERRDGELGNTYEFEKLVNTLRVVRYAPMSEPLIFTPRKAKYTITTAPYEQSVGIDLQKILTRQHTIGEFASMSAEAVTRHYVNLTLTAIDTACASGNTDIRGRDLRSEPAAPNVDKASIDYQLRRMYSYNDSVTVWGHRYALDPLFDIAAPTTAADAAQEELRNRGVIGTYRGARLVSVQDEYNMWTGNFTSINGTDWEKLLFLGSGVPGAILMERDLSALNWQELDPERAWFRTGIRWDHGILVHSNWRYGVIEMT